MTADSCNHSPRSPVTSTEGGGGVVNSPSRRRSLPSPWAQVVRGAGDPETISLAPPPPRSPSSPSPEQQTPFSDNSESPAAVDATAESQLESADSSNNGNVGPPKKAAWSKPLNGVVEGGHVMGAASWPALSESTRPVPKSSTESSSKQSIPDGSTPVSQGSVISHSPQKQAKTNANSNSAHNHPYPARQRLMRRGGSTGGGMAGFNRPQPPPPPPPPMPPTFPVFEMPYVGSGVLDSPGREPLYKGNNWVTRPMTGVASQSHSVNDQSSHRNPSRRGGFGGRPRGDGLYMNGYGGRRDHDRDWHSPRSSTTRPPPMIPPPPPPPRGYIGPPPPGSIPFIPPQPMRPFNPLGYDMASPYLYVPTLPPEPFRGAPLLPHAPPPGVLIPIVEPPTLPSLIIKQIDYYFSDFNLLKDNFLKSNMDSEGWVPISLIAGFPRVQSLTSDIQLILDSLRDSTVVEVQGDKVRRRNEWRKYIRIMDSGSHSPHGAADSLLVNSIQKLAVDEVTTSQASTSGTADAPKETVPDTFSSLELTESSKLANGKVDAEAFSNDM